MMMRMISASTFVHSLSYHPQLLLTHNHPTLHLLTHLLSSHTLYIYSNNTLAAVDMRHNHRFYTHAYKFTSQPCCSLPALLSTHLSAHFLASLCICQCTARPVTALVSTRPDQSLHLLAHCSASFYICQHTARPVSPSVSTLPDQSLYLSAHYLASLYIC